MSTVNEAQVFFDTYFSHGAHVVLRSDSFSQKILLVPRVIVLSATEILLESGPYSRPYSLKLSETEMAGLSLDADDSITLLGVLEGDPTSYARFSHNFTPSATMDDLRADITDEYIEHLRGWDA